MGEQKNIFSISLCTSHVDCLLCLLAILSFPFCEQTVYFFCPFSVGFFIIFYLICKYSFCILGETMLIKCLTRYLALVKAERWKTETIIMYTSNQNVSL